MIDPETRSILRNAFQPGGAISLPNRFAGRKSYIKDLTDALDTDGMCPVVFGEKGLGKSSLANQLERISLGDVELLEDLGLKSYSIPEGRRFVVFYLQCTDAILNKDELLQRLVNIGSGFPDVDSLPRLRKGNVEHKDKISLKFYESEVRTTYEKDNLLEEFIQLSIEERLIAIVKHIANKHGKSVLFIIDELDRVDDTSGLASFIKSNSGPLVRFLLVGVAHTLSTLLKDHTSLDRLVVPIRVQRMDRHELEKIVDLVQVALLASGVDIKFDPNAKSELANLADGFPWFVHILGQDSLIRASDSQDATVTVEHVLESVSELSFNRYARNFEDTYQKAVGDSRQREIVIRSFAKWGGKDIPTSDIYPVCHYLQVTNPSSYVKELQAKKRGTILAKAPFRESGVYSFTNSMFRQYVELRPSLYNGVKEQVDNRWLMRSSK